MLVKSFLALVAATGAIAAPAVDGASSFQQLVDRSTPTGTGTNNGFFYSFYNSGSDSTVTYNNKAAGEFSVDWTNCDNFVAGKGWKTGSDRSIKYSGTWNAAKVNSYVSVYGWTTSPLVEYYIVESFGDYNPSSGGEFSRNTICDTPKTQAQVTNKRENSLQDLLGHHRRRHIRHLQDAARQPAQHPGHRHLRPVLVRPPQPPRRRHRHGQESLRRLVQGRPNPGLARLPDPRRRGLQEQRIR